MTTEIREIRQITDDILISYLDSTGATSKLTKPEKDMFFNIAKGFNLNPFKREIFCTVYGEGQYRQLSIITGYEVYIKRAERSGQLDGWKAETFGSVATNDLKAVVTIYRKDRKYPFEWEVHYNECVQRTKTGAVTKFWEKANFMTKKVAISQGFRLCFSDELGGMPYTADEMPSHEETIEVSHVVIDEPVSEIPSLTNDQFEKAMNSDFDTIGKFLTAIEKKKLTATTEEYLQLQHRQQELKEI